jgi:ribonuclease P protein component
MEARLGRSRILLRKRDFEQVLFRGRRVKQGPAALYFAPNPQGLSRVAFIATGKFKGAVTRNRVRRRLRAVYRTNQQSFPAGFDYILRGEPAVAEWSYADLQTGFLKMACTVQPA